MEHNKQYNLKELVHVQLVMVLNVNLVQHLVVVQIVEAEDQ